MQSTAALKLPHEVEPVPIVHRCLRCGQAFVYRHDGHYHLDTLWPVDWICRSCFPRWVAEQEVH
ncbi:hypothetical protein [Sulfobacillus harzensis]|uniref:C2H2-type domain-containing protein n=1 Tax=Sulfobacillus harzensis TaxID=2729629 RepID=A0A7Y0Q479_9FIRM|nr:hypothetical protein [Sulfobacillus harzensis]NMP22954.1 hypothetical protein [Sulfobacillus harzensis]